MDVGKLGQVLRFGLGIASSLIAIVFGFRTDQGQKFIHQIIGPGYSCADRRILNDAETAVCDSWTLSRMDVLLSNAYYNACGNLDKSLADDELKWIRSTRDACKGDTECLTKVYNERLQSLTARARARCI